MEEERPNPDQLLKEIHRSETTKSDKGKLKIFFGYAAGVGKTYAMLDSAHAAKAAGVDVVVGYVEPHTRPDTLALLNGLEQLPPLKVAYKGIVLNEFDLDAALARKPQLVLVDELAHTNAESCRHTKRYSDIEELLKAGIDVYTTVNVQHLESLNDIVASITQVVVKERIPDSVFDKASQVKLVDIEPDDLIERLTKGKIYKETQAKRALNNFFVRDNLVALREIALRRTADRVNRVFESNKLTKNSEYYTGEHILICLSSSPSNAKVIRTAARMASAFHAGFTALFVETPNTKELSSGSLSRLRENLKLAEQLGAKIATVYGEDVPYQISEYAKASGVSKIVVGRSNSKPNFFRRKNSFVERLTTLAPNLDVHIIPDNLPPYQPAKTGLRRTAFFSFTDFAKLVTIMALCTVISFVFYEFGFSEANIITIYILGVLLVSNQTKGRLYGILSSLVGVLTFNFFFTVPRFTFNAYGAEYPVTFGVMLFAALITSTLTLRVRGQAKETALKAHRTEVLLETSQMLQRARGLDEIIDKASRQLLKLLDKPIMFYRAREGLLEAPLLFYPEGWEPKGEAFTTDAEHAVAAWVLKNRSAAGANTDTLPGSKAIYLPVRSHEAVFAVVGVAMPPDEHLAPFERSLLSAMLNETAFALEKHLLNESQKEASMEAEKERLRANLLRAISHDLRTPLTSISGNASVLLSEENQFDTETRHKLYEDIYDDSMWLINLVENLLSVTRIDNGTMNINMQPELVEEIIAEALRHINRKSSEHPILVTLTDDLLMARTDARLIIQVIINIVDNAIKYTEPGAEIKISAFRRRQSAVIEISDNGSGVLDSDKEHLFDMFYTTKNCTSDSRRGLGLGLSLCKSIVNAHGGEIYVKDNEPKGTTFGFTLKLEEVKGA